MKNIILFSVISTLFLYYFAAADDKETEDFNKYLKEVHGLTIPDSIHNFYIVDLDDCKGCLHKNLCEVAQAKKWHPELTIIALYKGNKVPEIVNDLQIKDSLLYDRGKKFLKTSLGHYFDPIIITNNKKITEIYEIEDIDVYKNIQKAKHQAKIKNKK